LSVRFWPAQRSAPTSAVEQIERRVRVEVRPSLTGHKLSSALESWHPESRRQQLVPKPPLCRLAASVWPVSGRPTNLTPASPPQYYIDWSIRMNAIAVSPRGKTKEKMIDATITLMRRNGFHGTGLNEILKESGAPKGSMYHFFPEGKRQIAGEAIAVYAKRVRTYMDESLSSAKQPAAKIHALFSAVAQRLERAEFRQSCAAGATCLDLDDNLEVVRLAIATMFSDCVDLIARHFAIRDARRRRWFAGLVLTVIEGAYIRGRAERSIRPLEEAAFWLADIAEREVSAAVR
jgi:TetR/AcrR family transcriptional repressor of lmrAB and yxaGH operons